MMCFEEEVLERLSRIERLIISVLKGERILMASLDEVIDDVTAEGTQIDGLTTLTAGIKAQLDAALAGALTPAQQAKIDAIFAGVEANKQKVVDAINANTPAAPTA